MPNSARKAASPNSAAHVSTSSNTFSGAASLPTEVHYHARAQSTKEGQRVPTEKTNEEDWEDDFDEDEEESPHPTAAEKSEMDANLEGKSDIGEDGAWEEATEDEMEQDCTAVGNEDSEYEADADGAVEIEEQEDDAAADGEYDEEDGQDEVHEGAVDHQADFEEIEGSHVALDEEEFTEYGIMDNSEQISELLNEFGCGGDNSAYGKPTLDSHINNGATSAADETLVLASDAGEEEEVDINSLDPDLVALYKAQIWSKIRNQVEKSQVTDFMWETLILDLHERTQKRNALAKAKGQIGESRDSGIPVQEMRRL